MPIDSEGRDTAAKPAGWRLVPVEPTEAMHAAAVKTIVRCNGNDDFPPRVWRAMLASAPLPAASAADRAVSELDIDYQRIGLLEWAVTRWREDVQNRPMVNIYRPGMDKVWRQVIRYAGGDPDAIVGPRTSLPPAPPADRAELAKEAKRLVDMFAEKRAIQACFTEPGELQGSTDIARAKAHAAIEALARSTDAPSEPLWIALGHGNVEVAEGEYQGMKALIFGRNGSGLIGEPTVPNREHQPGETLVVVTFKNASQSLDIVADKLAVIRSKISSATLATPPAAATSTPCASGAPVAHAAPTDSQAGRDAVEAAPARTFLLNVASWLDGGADSAGRLTTRQAMAAQCRKYAATLAGGAPNHSTAARDVLAERRRQFEVEGWTPERDDEYSRGQLASAAACYVLNAAAWLRHGPGVARKKYPELSPINWTNWPWREGWWKPANERRDLVKAGALILAEIERLDRMAAAGRAPE